MKGLPAWLCRSYCALYTEFGETGFALADAEAVLKKGGPALRAIVSLLRRSGYLKVVGRKGRKRVYRAIDPRKAVLIMGTCERIRREVRDPAYVKLLSLYAQKLFERYGDRVRSVVLYGSIARGKPRRTSDIDLLLVIDGAAPGLKRYEEMASIKDDDIREATLGLWNERRVYPTFQPRVLTPDEAMYHHPTYLDMTEDAVFLYDRDAFMRTILDDVRKRLAELKAKRVELPDGRWYWVLKPEVRRGEVVEI